MIGCMECAHEHAIVISGPPQDTAECIYCNSVWSVEWVRVPMNGARGCVHPKMTLVNDRADHWQSLGLIALRALPEQGKAA